MEQIIYKLIKQITKSYSCEYFWIDIRLLLPNDNYKMRRWHYDGTFFINNKDALQAKFVTILKGPGTMFLKNGKKASEIYDKIQETERNEFRIFVNKNKNKNIDNKEKIKINIEYQEKYRPIYEKALKIIKESELKNNQGLIFITNHKNHFIHSEPNIDKPRFFISILPGSKENIEALAARWNY